MRIGSGNVSLMLHMTCCAEIIMSFSLALVQPYTPYSARMSPENIHKLMVFYMED